MCFLPGFVFLTLNKLNTTGFETVKSLDKASAELESSQGLICLIALEFHCQCFVCRNSDLEKQMVIILNPPKQKSERSMVFNSTVIQAVGPHVSDGLVGLCLALLCCIHLVGLPPMCNSNTCRASSGLFAEVIWSWQVWWSWFTVLAADPTSTTQEGFEYILGCKAWGTGACLCRAASG